MKKNYDTCTAGDKPRLRNKIKMLMVLSAMFIFATVNSQVLVPYSGSNTITCGTNTQLQDHSGYTGYSNYAYGYTVLEGGYQGVINLTGPYDVESWWDYINIYDGIGNGGTLLQSYTGWGNINFTSQPGQTITVEFVSDGSVAYTGFDFTVSYSGLCQQPPCSGAPIANSVLGPNVEVCPGTTLTLGMANTYTNSGITYQWYESNSSAIGPYTAIAGATMATYDSPLINQNVFYTNVITCNLGPVSTTAAPLSVSVAATTTNNVYYYESFENLVYNGLPNCSWGASDLGGATLTYTAPDTYGRVARTGNNFASFSNQPAGTNFFYSNGLWLEAGVTYSASIWFRTESVGYTNWTDLSLMFGGSQSPQAMQSIVSTNGPAVSNIHKQLSGNFSVNSSGFYYIGVRATSSNGNAPYLSFDDLEVGIPCDVNAPQMSLFTNSTTICQGQSANLTAIGADTYLWNTAATSSAVSVSPQTNTTYTVVGTNLLTGCSTTLTQMVNVNQAPQLIIHADNGGKVCGSKPLILSAYGANSFNWSTGDFGAFATVTPTANTTYTVYGVGANGCIGMATREVTVNSLPNVTANASTEQLCVGQTVVLTGSGASSYQWSSNAGVYAGSPVNVTLQSSTVFTLSGTDANGFTNTAKITLDVNECTGINETASAAGVKVYPNPNNGEFVVELNNGNASIEVFDATGRLVFAQKSADSKVKVNISKLSNGVYYVKVKSNDSMNVIKVVKD